MLCWIFFFLFNFIYTNHYDVTIGYLFTGPWYHIGVITIYFCVHNSVFQHLFAQESLMWTAPLYEILYCSSSDCVQCSRGSDWYEHHGHWTECTENEPTTLKNVKVDKCYINIIVIISINLSSVRFYIYIFILLLLLFAFQCGAHVNIFSNFS